MPAFRQVQSQLAPSGFVQPGPAAKPLDITPIAQGLSAVANEMQRQDDDQAIFEARRKLSDWESRTIYDPEKGAVTLKGRDAFDLPKVLPEAFDNNTQAILDTLPNDRVRMVVKNLAQARREQVMGWADRHALQERDIFHETQFQADVSAFKDRAARLAAMPTDGTKEGAAKQADQAQAELAVGMDRITSYLSTKKGLSPEAIVVAKKDFASGAHEQIIKNMQVSDPKAALAYFELHKGAINAARFDDIGRPLNAMVAATEGDKGADAVWATLGPKADMDPVQLDKMESAVRERFAGDKPRMDAAITGLRQRAEAFNSSQRERAAGNTNTVFGMIDKGTRMVDVMRSPAWNALPEKEQRQIRLSLEQEAATRENRAAAIESRAASAESRAFTKMQRDERMALMNNAGDYLSDSDPDKLARMSRDQVAALRTKYGFEATQHLLNRFDTLQKPGAIGEARMDTQDFNHVADQMGLRPYETRKSEEEKKTLGEMQYRVEQLINVAQQQKKQVLTRDEKMALMQGEFARQVTVNPGWFSSNKQMPVIQLQAGDIKNVVVPQADYVQIGQALQAMRARDPKNPLYQQTEANVRRLYLAKQSRAASLLPPEK